MLLQISDNVAEIRLEILVEKSDHSIVFFDNITIGAFRDADVHTFWRPISKRTHFQHLFHFQSNRSSISLHKFRFCVIISKRCTLLANSAQIANIHACSMLSNFIGERRFLHKGASKCPRISSDFSDFCSFLLHIHLFTPDHQSESKDIKKSDVMIILCRRS